MIPPDSLFRNPDFRRIWAAEVISDAGSFVTFIALAVYVHELTGETFAVGLALALRGIPWVTIGPLAGVIVDRIDRRLVMIVCDLARALLVGLLPFTTEAWQAYTISFASGCFSPAFRPARLALLPLVAPGPSYLRAVAVSEVSHQVLHTLGPALGGAVVLAVGTRQAFVLDAATFLVSAALILGVRARGEARGRPRSVRDVLVELEEGMRFLGKDRLLRTLVAARALDLLTLGDGAVALLLIYVSSLGRGSGSFGLALAAAGLGAVVGTVILGRRRPGTPRRYALVAVAAGSAIHLLFLQRPPYLWLLVVLAIGAIPVAALTLYVSMFIAERVPDSARGRVFALTGAIFEAGDVLGSLLFAALGARIGPAPALATGGALGALAVGGMVAFAFPLLRASDRLRAVLSSPDAPIRDPE